MKFFLVLPLLLLLFDSSKESVLSHKRGLDTTLQTNFNGSYQRKNPCTNAEIESSSYVASHKFHHHINQGSWSDYSHRCSEIISSFLRGIGNLVRFNSKQNGTFNFHINTSISQKQDGNCLLSDRKKCNSLPTIILEAESCQLPPSCKCLSREEARQKPTEIVPSIRATIRPAEKYSSTTQCPTLSQLQDEGVKYQTGNIEQTLLRDQKCNDGLVSKVSPVPGLPRSRAQAEIGGTKPDSRGFFNDFTQSTEFPVTSTPQRDFPTQPEDQFTSVYPDIPATSTRGLQNTFDVTPPVRPTPLEDFTAPKAQNYPYYPSESVSGFETTPQPPFVNDDRLITGQYLPKKPIFNDLGEEVPNKPPQQSFPEFSSTPAFESSPVGKPFRYQQPLEEPPQPDFNVPVNFEEIPSSDRFQPVEQTTTYPRVPFPSESRQFAPEDDKFPLRQQTEPVRGVDGMYVDRTPYSTRDRQVTDSSSIPPSLIQSESFAASTYPPQFEESNETASRPPKVEKLKPGTSSKDRYPNPPESSSNPLHTTEFEEYEETASRPPQVEILLPRTFPEDRYPNPPESSSNPPQTNEFEEYDETVAQPPPVDDFFPSEEKTTVPPINTSPGSAYPDYDPQEFSRPTTPMVDELPTTPLPFPDRPTNVEKTDSFYDVPTTDSFVPERLETPLTRQPFSQSRTESAQDYFEQNGNINEPIRDSDQQPLMTPSVNRFSDPPRGQTTSLYNKPEVYDSFPSTAAPKEDFRVSEEPRPDYEMTTAPRPEFYDGGSDPAPEFVTEPPPSQIPPPPIFSAPQESYDNQPDDFQPKAQHVTSFYDQTNQMPNASGFSGDYGTALPSVPKSRQNTADYPEEGYPNQEMTIPAPALYSEPIPSESQTTPDYQGSFFPKTEEQSFVDVPSPKQPIEKFPESLTKYPAERPHFETDSPIEQPSSYLTTVPPRASNRDLPTDYYSPVFDGPPKFTKPLPEPSRDVSPNPESFTIYDSQYSDEPSRTQDVKPESNPDFLIEETTPSYNPTRFTEPVPPINSELLTSTSEEFEPQTTPLPPVTYPEDDFYSSSSPSTVPIPPPGFEPVSYSEASSQASAEVYENQNDQPNADYQDSSVFPPPLKKEAPYFDSKPLNIEMTVTTPSFQQPPVNNMREYQYEMRNTRPPATQSFETTVFEPEFQPTMRPTESRSSDLENQLPRETFSEDYQSGFPSTTQSPETQGLSASTKAQSQTFLAYSNAQSDSESVTNRLAPTNLPPEDLPIWTDRPRDSKKFTEPLPEEDISDFDYPEPSPNTPYQPNSFDSSQEEQRPLNQFPSTVSPPTTDYPSPMEPPSQTQPPLGYYEEIPDRYSQQPLAPPQPQPRELSNSDYIPKPPTYQVSTPVEEPFMGDVTTRIPQTSSYLPEENMPNYSPPFEPQPQPQPSYDNFSDIPGDNTPLLASRTFENSKTTNQYPVTSFPNTRRPSNFREDPNMPFSNDFITTPTPFSVTDIPSRPDLEFLNNGNEENGAQETLLFADKVSPQPQPTSAVNYDEEMETTQYQTSPAPSPQPQTTLNYANQLSDDNPNGKLPEFFTNQQDLRDSDSNDYPIAKSSSSATAFVGQPDQLSDDRKSPELFTNQPDFPNSHSNVYSTAKASSSATTFIGQPDEFSGDITTEKSPQFFTNQPDFQNSDSNAYTVAKPSSSATAFVGPTPSVDDFPSENEMMEQISTLPPRDENYQQSEEIRTTDYVTQPPLNDPNPDTRSSYLPYSNQLRSQPVYHEPSSPEQERIMNPSQNRVVNFERGQERGSSHALNSERPETYIPYNERPPMAPQRRPQQPNYRRDYDWMPRDSRPLPPNSQVLPERFYNPKQNPNFYRRIPQRPSSQEFLRRYPQPQQDERYYEGGFPSNTSYPDYMERRPQVYRPFPGQDYPEYDQVFPNPPPRQRFDYDEVFPRDSQKMGDRQYERRHLDTLEEQPRYQGRPMGHPVNYPPPPPLPQQQSNPLFHTLESQMNIPIQEPNESFLSEPNYQNDYNRWEHPNPPPPRQQDNLKSPQPESDLTVPSNNPDRTTDGRFDNMDRPLREPFYEDKMRPISTPERF